MVLLGDFNLHIDTPDKWDTKKFAEIISNAGLYQHVKGPTHTLGHTLDLVMSHEDDDLIQDVRVDPLHHSDHHIVTCTMKCEKPPPLRVSITSRQYGKMDHELFTELLHKRLSDIPKSSDPFVLAESYTEITSSVLDEICPFITRERTVKPCLPWYNDVIHTERRI